eukprot:EG_transcript_5818
MASAEPPAFPHAAGGPPPADASAQPPAYGRFEVTYAVAAAAEAEARAMGNTIAYEQTLELPQAAYPDMTLGTVQSVRLLAGRAPPPSRLYEVVVSYDERCAGGEVPQFLNVLYGNTSLKRVEVDDVALGDSHLADCMLGPRFGVEGLRQLCGVCSGPLVCTALKPMGKCTAELAAIAYAFAKGGIHIVKDDHGLANQPWAPFQQRVEACAKAVRRANEETGRRCLYAPCLNVPAEHLMEQAHFAKRAGAGALMVLPGISGWDAIRAMRNAEDLGLPIICHPALLGASLGGSLTPGCVHGLTHGLLLGKLPRLLGADATIFPNVGGRFSFTADECQSIVEACLSPSGSLQPAFPMLAGGMKLDAIPGIRRAHCDDVALLIGGDVLLHSPDLEANARLFVAAVRAAPSQLGLAPLPEAPKGAPPGAAAPEPKWKRQRVERPLEGNHGKVLRFATTPVPSGMSRWVDVPLEDYKPPADKSWSGITRTELAGKRGESCLFHTRYFEVRPGGHTTLEKHQHEHVVIVFRGAGWCVLGDRAWQLREGDVVYTSPGEVHQFGCDENAQQEFGFFCIVNAVRDRPVPQDSTAVEICE